MENLSGSKINLEMPGLAISCHHCLFATSIVRVCWFR